VSEGKPISIIRFGRLAEAVPDIAKSCECNTCIFGRKAQEIVDATENTDHKEFLRKALLNDMYNLDFEHNMAEMALNELKRYFPNIAGFCGRITESTKQERMEALEKDALHTTHSEV
jgi:hypothetical protein